MIIGLQTPSSALNMFDDPLVEALAEDRSEEERTASESAHAQPAASIDHAYLCGLIARIGQKDEAALGELYDATLSWVYGLALRITRNAQTAEEVAEDTFWQVWRQALRFDLERGKPLAWLLVIARSRALDALRRADESETYAEPESFIAAERAREGDPQDLLDATQERSLVHAALQKLEPLPRQLLALAFFRGMTHEEIASHAQLPLGTVKSHIRRALTALREMLSGSCADGVAT